MKKTTTVNSKTVKKSKSEKTALKLENIVKFYGEGENKVQALKGVDLCFRKNEFVSILGPSGCGKTTLLNIIGGLDRYSSGDLVIEGKSTKNYNDKDWDAYRNNSIGFVFQSYNLIPHQTVLGNVELALELSGVKKTERRKRAKAMLEKVGLKDHLKKKPNQLSGGQMQRVAIARALINDPEIILADEPTGALDTETSIQIMELLKEVAKKKLVIMVTHNPDLAEKYSTRIIKLLDGKKVHDSNPFEEVPVKELREQRKPKMGLRTAFALSLKNLISKRARTILTSVAGSIGIIGVALVLALSNGFSAYMDRMQTDSLATYPITISESSIDLSSFNDEQNAIAEKYPEFKGVLPRESFSKLTSMLKSNKLNDENILNYINGLNKKDYYAIQNDYGFDMNEYLATDICVNSNVIPNMDGTPTFMAIDSLVKMIEEGFDDQMEASLGVKSSFVRQYIPTITELPNSADLLNEQYEMLAFEEGVSFESVLNSTNQVLLVVDKTNKISDITLALLGYVGIDIQLTANGDPDITFFKNGGGEVSYSEGIPYNEIIGKDLYYLTNNDIYKNISGSWYDNPLISKTGLVEQKLEIVGVIREKENVSGILKTGFVYSPLLTEKVLNANMQNGIAKEMIDNTLNTILINNAKGESVNTSLRSLGGVDTPSKISIYAKDFDSKERIKTYFDTWNDSQTDESMKITYSDMMSMLFSALTTMVDAVTYVLVAFTSISLIVSSVMIGIITYVSVVERTKEIGVLRSLGASKREVSKIFNAETFLIGLFAGLIGIGVTYLLSIPINLIIGNLVPSIGKIADLNPFVAVGLVVISFALTMIAGLIPSKIAAKKDPVVALRSE